VKAKLSQSKFIIWILNLKKAAESGLKKQISPKLKEQFSSLNAKFGFSYQKKKSFSFDINSVKTLGLEFSDHALKIAFLSYEKGKFELKNVLKIPLEKNEGDLQVLSFSDVKRFYIENAKIKEEDSDLKDLMDKSLVSTALSQEEVLVRPLEIKLKKKKDIEAALPFQAETLLPFPLDVCLIDKITLGQSNESTNLTLFVTKKEHLKKHLAKWQLLQIEPEIVTSESLALTSFANRFLPSLTHYFIVSFKEKNTSVSLIKEKKLVASQACSFDENEENHLNEITRIIYSLSKQAKGANISDVLILGADPKTTAHFEKALAKINKVSCSLEQSDEFSLSESELKAFAIPIGLSIAALEKEKINFRQEELSFPDPWKHLKKPFICLFGLSFFLAFAFYLFGNAYLGTYEDHIKKEYAALLSSMHKPYYAFEAEYLTKFPNPALQEGEFPLIKELSQDDLNGRLKFLYQELQAAPDLFPLFPNIPRVSDVLGWLSTHPQIVSIDPITGNKIALIQLEAFSYSMLKRPEQSKKQERYQVKVEFEFSTETPKLAREFHDALIAPNSIVDPKGEVKWSSNRGKYKTSFFLKDKTVYPSSRS